MKNIIKLNFFIILCTFCTSDGQEAPIIVKEPTVQEETSNSTSDSSSSDQTSDNTNDNSNSNSDSSSGSNSSGDNTITVNNSSVAVSNSITANLNKTQFINEQIGFIVGDGVVFKSNNGGESWQPIVEDDNIEFTAIHFENESIGLLGGNDGYYSYVYLTNNGGLTWEGITRIWYSNEPNEVVSLYGNNNSKNLIVFINQYPNATQTYGHVYVSKNTGQDWTRIGLSGMTGIGSTFNLNDKVYFMSKSRWTGSSYATSFYESYFLDQESERIDIYNLGNLSSNDMFFNSELGYSCGEQGDFAITSDFGKNWTSKTIQGYTDSNFSSIDFNLNSDGIMSTNEGEILISTDNGQSWNLRYDLGQKINSIEFINQEKFIVIGNEGLLEILEF